MVDDGDRMTVDDRDVLGDQSLQRLGISDDPPGVEDDDPVGVPSGEVQLVEHHHDRVAGIGELSGDHQHELLMAEVECRGRLVEQHHRRALGEDAGHVDERLLASRQRGERAVGEIQRPHAIKGGHDHRAVVAAVVPREAPDRDHAACVEREQGLRVLWKHAAGAGQFERLHRPDGSAVERDRAALRCEVTGKHGEQRRLARAVRADKGSRLAGVKFKAHVVKFCAQTACAPMTCAPMTCARVMRTPRTRAGCAG